MMAVVRRILEKHNRTMKPRIFIQCKKLPSSVNSYARIGMNFCYLAFDFVCWVFDICYWTD